MFPLLLLTTTSFYVTQLVNKLLPVVRFVSACAEEREETLLPSSFIITFTSTQRERNTYSLYIM